ALGAASADLSNLFKDPTRIWNYGGSLLGPIFTGGAITAQVRQSEGAQKAAVYGYEQTVQSAFADVENSLITRQKTDEKLQAQQRLVDALNQYSELARLQYKGGYVPYSTVLQAEQQLFPAELTLAQYRGQLYSSAVGVYLSLGGGWVTLADDMTASSSPVERPPSAPAQ
ncbi:MAG: TolC family protein, partial [Burkholderiaceae bacterium]